MDLGRLAIIFMPFVIGGYFAITAFRNDDDDLDIKEQTGYFGNKIKDCMLKRDNQKAPWKCPVTKSETIDGELYYWYDGTYEANSEICYWYRRKTTGKEYIYINFSRPVYDYGKSWKAVSCYEPEKCTTNEKGIEKCTSYDCNCNFY